MTSEIVPVDASMVAQLQAISVRTFTETFAPFNSEADIEKHNEARYNQPQLLEELTQVDSDFFFIYYEQNLAGYLKLNRKKAQSEPMSADYLEVERIYILEHFKRLGLGKALMDYAFDYARTAQLKKLWLGVWEHNKRALAFYASMGYQPISEHVFTLGGSQQRDLIMAIELDKE